MYMRKNYLRKNLLEHKSQMVECVEILEPLRLSYQFSCFYHNHHLSSDNTGCSKSSFTLSRGCYRKTNTTALRKCLLINMQRNFIKSPVTHYSKHTRWLYMQDGRIGSRKVILHIGTRSVKTVQGCYHTYFRKESPSISMIYQQYHCF